MVGEVRQQMVAGAVRLLARRGLQATSFAEVIAATGAPRGSIYHHFPEGKDQLVAAAVDLAGDRAIALLDTLEGRSATEVTTAFLDVWRQVLTVTTLTTGCAVLAVTVATDSDDLLDRAAGVFRRWRVRLAELLTAGGLAADDAARFAATLVAASEGAVVLARAERSMEPFELVADDLVRRVTALAG